MKSRRNARGSTTAPGKEVRAGLLPLLDERDRDVAEPLRHLRLLLEQLTEPDRAGEAAGAAADDQDADLDPLVGGIGRRADRLRARERRRIIRRPHAHPRRSFTSCVSFGTMACRSPTTPKSAKSKIGRVRVLVDRHDRARPLHPDLVLDRSGDAECDVELRRDRLAGLPDLGRVRVPARVDDCARRRDGAAQRLRELLAQAEALGRAEARGHRRRSRRRPRSRRHSSPRAPARSSARASRSPRSRR